MSTFAEKTELYTLPNGARISATPFGASDVVSISGSVAGGYMYAQGRALAELHAMMLTEGTKQTSKTALQERLDAMGTSVSFSPAVDRLEFSAKVRREYLFATLELIAEMLAAPAFPQKELSVLIARMEGALALEAENTRTQSAISLSHLLYEVSHPNRATTTERTKRDMRKVAATHLRKYHERTIFASTLILSMAGSVASGDCKKAASLFARLPAGAPAPLRYPPASASPPGAAIAFVPAKESVDYQLGVRAAINRRHSEYLPLLLAVNILGRPGFAGRLMQKVREEQGLTYGTYAFLRGFSNVLDGHIAIWSTFAPTLFARGRASVRAEVARLQKSGPSQEEFGMHRDLFIANWRVKLAKTDAIADAVHDTLVEGDGPAYLDTLPERVAQVTLQAVRSACKKYFTLHAMAETAAGTLEKDAL